MIKTVTLTEAKNTIVEERCAGNQARMVRCGKYLVVQVLDSEGWRDIQTCLTDSAPDDILA